MADARASGGERPLYSNGYKAAVLGLLLATYTFNFIDRTIIATIGQAIKVDLKLTDTQLGLLGGLYFALALYDPGHSDRAPGRALQSCDDHLDLAGDLVGLHRALRFGFQLRASWPSTASASASAKRAAHRPSHALISDYFEPKKRASALSIYSFGIPLGTMFGAVAGGWLAQEFSWRVAFIIVGLPGVILAALIVKLVVKEPPRGHSEIVERPLEAEGLVVEPAPKPAFSHGQRVLRTVDGDFKILFFKWPVLHMMLGVTIASFGSYGSGAFVPSLFRARNFGLGLAQVGLDHRPDRRLLGGHRHAGRRLPQRLGRQEQRQVVRLGRRHRPADLPPRSTSSPICRATGRRRR
jgi:hypothetical protein